MYGNFCIFLLILIFTDEDFVKCTKALVLSLESYVLSFSTFSF